MPQTEERAVDTSSWDGPAVMAAGAASDDPAAFYRAVCAGRRAGDPALQSSWALPHHGSPNAGPNATGVRNALSRLPQTQGLTNRAAAQSHLDAHLAEINAGRTEPPHNDLIRTMPGYIELRQTEDSRPLLSGHFSVFKQWTHIRSLFEGEFMEQIAPGAFADTIEQDRTDMKVLFQHGQDPQLGDKPLGPITELREDEIGAYYEVPLIPTSYNRDMEEMLRAGLLGSSFRFNVTLEDFEPHPKRSDHNPEGLPERTIRGARVREFGPVTFPAYAGATAGVRSDTDIYLQRLLVPTRELAPVPAGVAVAKSSEPTHRFRNTEEYLKWLTRS